MPVVSVDSFLPSLYADEGWQQHLSSDGVALIVRGLEDRFEPGVEIAVAHAEAIARRLRALDAELAGLSPEEQAEQEPARVSAALAELEG